jgi:hypothetical protein
MKEAKSISYNGRTHSPIDNRKFDETDMRIFRKGERDNHFIKHGTHKGYKLSEGLSKHFYPNAKKNIETKSKGRALSKAKE